MNRNMGSYEIQLENFEGPLDLLLHLIKKNEMDVYDIPMAAITDQYLTILDAMKTLNLDLAGEFLLMAATLLHIKSKLLLPGLMLIFLTGCGVGAVISGAGQAAVAIDNLADLGDAAESLAMNEIQREEFERNVRNLPGKWKGTTSPLLDFENQWNVRASFRWEGDKIVGQIAIDPCIPTLNLKVLFDGHSLVITGKENGRSFDTALNAFRGSVTKTTLTMLLFDFTSNIGGCPANLGNGITTLRRL